MAVVAIGSTVAGWFGATAVSGIVAGAIGGAIVGAVVGGVTAAISGGNIGDGILMGAVTGAVTGAFAGFAQSSTQMVSTGTATTTGGATIPAGTKIAAAGESGLFADTAESWTLVDKAGNTTAATQATQVGLEKAATAEATTAAGATDSEKLLGALGESTKEEAKITAWTEGGKALFTSVAESEAAKEKAESDQALLAAQQEQKIELEAFRPYTAGPRGVVTGFDTRQPTKQKPGTPVVVAPTAQAAAPGVLAAAPTASVAGITSANASVPQPTSAQEVA